MDGWSNHVEGGKVIISGRKRLNTIVSQIREGKVLHSHGGRPRVLDEESYKNCSDEIFGDSEITQEILAEHIHDEYHATFNRRYPRRYNAILEHEEDLQLPRRSLKGYILKLHSPPPCVGLKIAELYVCLIDTCLITCSSMEILW